MDSLECILEDARRTARASVFGILGGEPLLYPRLFEIFEKHRDSYFILFTNGTLLDNAVCLNLRELRNVSPLISIEGDPAVSDERRGGKGVFQSAMQALDACSANRLMTGVATSVCRSNFDYVTSADFVFELVQRGAHHLWYYIYRPVGKHPHPELALSSGQIRKLREFLVDIRRTAPITIIDAYWDAKGNPLCPAEQGISHHVNPEGYVEPCPPVQMADTMLDCGDGGCSRVFGSECLDSFRDAAKQAQGGCILMKKPESVSNLLSADKTVDTSGRGRFKEELEAMHSLPCHGDAPGIPERHWFYRLAKKSFFCGFGAYG
jgi:MoaA/NifB/PqqE/SkfB family radical SAM enzyme